MLHKNKWLAALLAAALLFSDCGGEALVGEAAPAATVSENHAAQPQKPAQTDDSPQADEKPEPETNPDQDTTRQTDSDGDETPAAPDKSEKQAQDDSLPVTEPPALRVGYVKNGEPLPAVEDALFLYNIPISFEHFDDLTLFALLNPSALLENGAEGALRWSMLRAKKGTAAGSESLLAQADDWEGFETVPAAPGFTLTMEKEEDGTFPPLPTARLTRIARKMADETAAADAASTQTKAGQTIADAPLTQATAKQTGEDSSPAQATGGQSGGDSSLPQTDAETADADAYDYYIRAAFYPTADPQPEDAFYAALTLPVLPQETAAPAPETNDADSTDETSPAETDGNNLELSTEKNVILNNKAENAQAATEASPSDILDGSGDIRVSGFQKESDAFVYTGQKIIQKFRVYHKETLLNETVDYTLTYQNNVNANRYDAANAPAVTVDLKGHYQGSVTLYFTIKPADLKAIAGAGADASPGYAQAVSYSKKIKIPAPALSFCGKKLSANRDFVCDYDTASGDASPLPADRQNGDDYTPNKVYQYTVNGIGNFTGSFPMQLVVVTDKGKNFSAASVKLTKSQYEYRGTANPLTKADVSVESVKLGAKTLDRNLYDYDVCADGGGSAYVLLSPNEAGKAAGYLGSKKVELALAGDRLISNASSGAAWKDSLPFSQKTVREKGGVFQEGDSLLSFGGEALTEGADYSLKYGNAKKAGTVTVTFTGKGRYRGTCKKQYQITPYPAQDISIAWKNVSTAGGKLTTHYQKGGAAPDFVLREKDGEALKKNTDYTLSLEGGKTPESALTCLIKGKGNYQGYEESFSIWVGKGNLELAALSAPDKPFSTKEGAWKSKVTVKDQNGKPLSAGKDYDSNVTYSCNGAPVTAPPAAGSVIDVKVSGLGDYAGSTRTGSYRIYNINFAEFRVKIDAKEYTGEEVTLQKSDIHVYASADDERAKNELPDAGSFYEIVGYQNNVKSGTAKVTLRGLGNYGGTKTCSFSIKKKRYQLNLVQGISFDKTSLSIKLSEKEKQTLTATVTPVDPARPISNPTVVWSSSDKAVATVEPVSVSEDKTATTVAIIPKGEGSATITAASRDGNKRIQCKVSVVDSQAILLEAGTTIRKNVGETHQLTFGEDVTQTVTAKNLVWRSDNVNAVSVSATGLLTMKAPGAARITVYRKSKPNAKQWCYAVALGSEAPPAGRVLTYTQKPGCTNDTPYINQLLRDWEWAVKAGNDPYDYFYLPAGIYRIDPVAGKSGFGGIVLTSGQKLVMSPAARIEAIPNSAGNYHVIQAFGRNNISISGGQIIGERSSHKGASGEWGHGIGIYGCKNVTIKDVKVSGCWGDGIYIGMYEGKSDYVGGEKNVQNPTSSGVSIENCILERNRRNNLSITDASKVTVNACQFNYASGTDPEFGIDIEPNSGNTCSNVTITNSSFKGNAKGSIQILAQLNAHIKNVTIKGCTWDKPPLQWAGFGGSIEGVSIQ